MKIDLSSIMEMIAEQDVETIENKNPPVVENKLQIEQLFKLFEEAEPLLKEEGPIRTSVPTKEPTISGEEDMVVTEEEILKLIIPQVSFTQNDITSGESIVKELASKLSKTKVGERLNELATLSRKQNNEPSRSTRSFLYLVNTISLLEGIIKVFSSFEAASAGFVTEMVLSSIFPDGERVNTEKANAEGLVTDFIVKGRHYVLKTVAEQSASPRSSSAYNYLNTLKRQREIIHVECQKISDEGELTAFNVIEFSVTPENIDQYLTVHKNPSQKDRLYLFLKNSDNQVLKYGEGPTASILYSFFTTESPNYTVARNAEEAKARFDLNERTTPEEKKEFLRQRKIVYGKKAVKDPERVDFSVGLEEMRKVLIETVRDVFKEIKILYTSLNTISANMGLYFTAGAQKNEIKQKLLSAAEQVQPKTKEITTKMEE